MHVCMHVYIYIYFYLFIHLYTRMYVCMHTYIYIYMYTYVCVFFGPDLLDIGVRHRALGQKSAIAVLFWMLRFSTTGS